MKPDTATGLVVLTALILLAHFKESAQSPEKEIPSMGTTLVKSAEHLSAIQQDNKGAYSYLLRFHHASHGNAATNILHKDHRRGE